MEEFVHTLSLKTHLLAEEKDNLTRAYQDKIFYNSKDGVFVLHKYAENGLRIEIKFNSKPEKKYDSKHREYKTELIITPAKLLFPGDAMAKLYTAEEYGRAFERLDAIFREIEFYSGVSLQKEAKIQRIDITKDITTESDEYSGEIIRLAKLALHKTGYHIWIPTKEDIARTGWAETDSAMFYNHNQEVSTKIYNKLTDLKNQNYDTKDIKGLLRLELTLKRNFLQNNGLIRSGYSQLSELGALISVLLDNAEALMQKHVAGPMWNGNFLSKKLQKKYIKRYCKTHESKYKKMLAYCDDCKKGIIVSGGKVIDYFQEITLSPLHTSKEFDYIPSFACMLGKEEDEKIKDFVKRQTQ
jgi:hypothetical protein